MMAIQSRILRRTRIWIVFIVLAARLQSPPRTISATAALLSPRWPSPLCVSSCWPRRPFGVAGAAGPTAAAGTQAAAVVAALLRAKLVKN
jgi:hypothetical protein